MDSAFQMPLVEWAGHRFALHPLGAVSWPSRGSVLITDPHFGKDAAFRSAGIPVPSGTTGRDLDRLSRILRDTAASRLIILGDFFHSAASQEPGTLEQLAAWRNARPHFDIILIRGNHDRSSGDPPPSLRIQCENEHWADAGLRFCHHPPDETPGPAFAGHIHPAIVLRERNGDGMRLRCFLFREQTALLPAFGGFTGSHVISPRPTDRVFGIVEDTVVELSAGRPTRPARSNSYR